MRLVKEERVTSGLNLWLKGNNHESCLIHISIIHFQNDAYELRSNLSKAASCEIVFHYDLKESAKTHRVVSYLHFLMPEGITRLRKGDDLSHLDDLWLKYMECAK